VSLAVAVAVVVVLTTAISHWLTRRGSTPEGAVRQFLLTAVVIGGVVFGMTLVTPLPGGEDALAMTLFFVVLMSVLITMYDRFLPRHVSRFGGS
jgi:predicted permease